MTWALSFSPFFSWTVLALIAAPAVLIALLLIAGRLRGALLRVAAIAALLLALALSLIHI